MQGGEFDEVAFFGAIHESGVRALLIGRRALVLLGLPVLTADYDFWIAVDQIADFNAAAARCALRYHRRWRAGEFRGRLGASAGSRARAGHRGAPPFDRRSDPHETLRR